jgi:hypothetical protein
MQIGEIVQTFGYIALEIPHFKDLLSQIIVFIYAMLIPHQTKFSLPFHTNDIQNVLLDTRNSMK